MMTIRRASERGHRDYGWLSTFHTFSFSDYHDPKHMGFRSLRVINDDRIAPGQGFGTHGHRDMEIISFVVEGALAHKDSMGNGAVVRPGEIQRMSAGTGITHSEFNPSPDASTQLLQIWIQPDVLGGTPSYEQKTFAHAPGALRLVASPDGAQGSVTIHADARMYVGRFDSEQRSTFTVDPGRHLWIHVVRGEVSISGENLRGGDGAAFSQEGEIAFLGLDAAQVLVFDLA